MRLEGLLASGQVSWFFLDAMGIDPWILSIRKRTHCPLHRAPPPRPISTTANKSDTGLDLKNMLNLNRENCEQILLALSRWPRESRRVGFWARSPPSFPTKLSDRRSFQQPSAYAKTQIRTSSTKCASISHRRVFCTNKAVFVHIASFNIFGKYSSFLNNRPDF